MNQPEPIELITEEEYGVDFVSERDGRVLVIVEWELGIEID